MLVYLNEFPPVWYTILCAYLSTSKELLSWPVALIRPTTSIFIFTTTLEYSSVHLLS